MDRRQFIEVAAGMVMLTKGPLAAAAGKCNQEVIGEGLRGDAWELRAGKPLDLQGSFALDDPVNSRFFFGLTRDSANIFEAGSVGYGFECTGGRLFHRAAERVHPVGFGVQPGGWEVGGWYGDKLTMQMFWDGGGTLHLNSASQEQQSAVAYCELSLCERGLQCIAVITAISHKEVSLYTDFYNCKQER